MVRNIPASVIFSFPVPNYNDPDTQGSALVIVNAIFISICAIAVLLRLYIRVFIKRWFGFDDIFIIFAFIATTGLTANVILANTRYYWNRHVWDIPPMSLPEVLKVAFSAKLLFVFAATFTRQSLLCFYYRLVADSDIRWFTWAVHLTVAFNIIICIVFTAIGIWLCHPIRAYWAIPSPPDSSCMEEGPVTLGIGVINSFIDLLVTILPIPVIARLQMPLRRRVGVTILLSLGIVVVVAGTVRTYYIWNGLMDSYDETWFTYPLWICAAVEIDLAVICACAPALRPLMSRVLRPAAVSVGTCVRSIISKHTRRPDQERDADRSSKSYHSISNSGISSTLGGYSGNKSMSSKLSSRISARHAPGPHARDEIQEEEQEELGFVTYPAIPAQNSPSNTPRANPTKVEEPRISISDDILPALPEPAYRVSTRNDHDRYRAVNKTKPLAPPSPRPRSLAIECRQSIELVHLDSGAAAGRDLDLEARAGSPFGNTATVRSGGGNQRRKWRWSLARPFNG